MHFGIIDYIPNDEHRASHREALKKQIDWIFKKYKDPKISVVAQQFQAEDYYREGEVEYLKFEKGIGPAGARNVLLKKYYATDIDYFVIADAEQILTDHYDGWKLIEEIDEDPDKFMQMDGIFPLCPRYTAYKFDMTTNRQFVERDWLFRRTGSPMLFNFTVLKNFKKHYNIEPLFDEQIFEVQKICEDSDFVFKLVEAGMFLTLCPQMILGGTGRYSVCFTNKSIQQQDAERRTCVHNCFMYVKDKYNLKSDTLNQCLGELMLQHFSRNSWIGLYRPRAVPYQFKDIDIYRRRTGESFYDVRYRERPYKR